jgi:hypothetical protein
VPVLPAVTGSPVAAYELYGWPAPLQAEPAVPTVVVPAVPSFARVIV